MRATFPEDVPLHRHPGTSVEGVPGISCGGPRLPGLETMVREVGGRPCIHPPRGPRARHQRGVCGGPRLQRVPGASAGPDGQEPRLRNTRLYSGQLITLMLSTRRSERRSRRRSGCRNRSTEHLHRGPEHIILNQLGCSRVERQVVWLVAAMAALPRSSVARPIAA